MSERRIVQIAVSQSLDARGSVSRTVYAVSDDGRAFAWNSGDYKWTILAALPASQDAKEARDA